MQRREIQRPGMGDGCYLFDVRLNIVLAIDGVLALYLCFMMYRECLNYSKYKKQGKCNKPFGLFWIGDFTSIVMFRIFYHLEKYTEYRLALVFFGNDNIRLRRARFWAVVVKVCKLMSYCMFLLFTILGSLWFVQDGRCLSQMDRNKDSNEYFKMALWLLGSFAVCLIYAIRVFCKLMAESGPSELVQADDNNRQFRRFMWADQARAPGMTKRELNALQKSMLRDYDELGRVGREPSRSPKEKSIEMTQLATNEPTPISRNSSLEIDEPDMKLDEDNPLKFTCAVCIEDIEIGEWYKKLPQCEHCFHATCIDQWLSTRATCPVCRQEVMVDDNAAERAADGSSPRTIPRQIRIISGIRDTQPRVVLRFTREVS